MPSFTLLRIQRDLLPPSSDYPGEMVAVKFFPFRNSLGEPVVITAADPLEAFSLACIGRSQFRHLLAVQESREYARTVAALSASRVQRNPEARRA